MPADRCEHFRDNGPSDYCCRTANVSDGGRGRCNGLWHHEHWFRCYRWWRARAAQLAGIVAQLALWQSRGGTPPESVIEGVPHHYCADGTAVEEKE